MLIYWVMNTLYIEELELSSQPRISTSAGLWPNYKYADVVLRGQGTNYGISL